MALASIERARKAGYSALVVTIDTPVAGLRERDLRNGMKELLTHNPLTMLPFVWQFASRPRWLAAFFRTAGYELPERVLREMGPFVADFGSAPRILEPDVARPPMDP